ncbi:unnamed protein product [Dicrocoelium dendriticum]|nr:unnamed protein product [Dicrocoelium dendriticum]
MVRSSTEFLLSLSFLIRTCVLSVPHYNMKYQQVSSILTDGDSVELTLTYTDRNRLRLRCDAKGIGAKESLVLLDCPLVHTGVCRQNCLSPCPIIDGVPNCRWNAGSPIKSCRQTNGSADRVTFEYDIELSSAVKSGHWRCMFRGRSSNSVRLEYQPLETITVESFPAVVPKPLTMTNASSALDAATLNQDVHSGLQLEFVTHLPLEVLLFILTLACISIMFNLWFMIRCFRMKLHLRTAIDGPPKCGWLDQIACLHPPVKWGERYFMTEARTGYIPANHVIYPDTNSLLTQTRVYGIAQCNTLTTGTPYVPSANASITGTALSRTARIGIKHQSDAVYDEVHNSVYSSSLNGPGGRRGVEHIQQAPTLLTSDGQEWMLDTSGQFYLPYGLQVPAIPVYDRRSYGPPEASESKCPPAIRPGARAPTPCSVEQAQYYSAVKRDAPALPYRPGNASFKTAELNNTLHTSIAPAESFIEERDRVDTSSLVTFKPAYVGTDSVTNQLNSSTSNRSVNIGKGRFEVAPSTVQRKQATSPSGNDPVGDDGAECIPLRTQELMRKGPKSYLEEWTFSD